MDSLVKQFVRERAGNRCEYCHLPQALSPLVPLQIEHVRPRKHQGSDQIENLALACIDCNLHKGSDVAGYDPETGAITVLFHPRTQVWSDHFELRGPLIVGLTAVGRVTAAVLNMNSDDQVTLRLLS